MSTNTETPEITYADPANERFPIHTQHDTLATWHQVNKPHLNAHYRPDELEQIRRRVARAARTHNLEVGD